MFIYFFFQAEDGIRYLTVTGVQTCALPIYSLEPCGIYFGTTGGQVYASRDSGDSWEPIVRDLPAVLSVEVQTLKQRSEEHTSELQSQSNLVCRLLLEKKQVCSPVRRTRRPRGRPSAT